MLRWSGPVQVEGARATRGFDVRTAGGRRLTVRSVRRTTANSITLAVAGAGDAASVRYLATTKVVRTRSGRAVPASTVAIRPVAASSQSAQPPRRTPTPTPTPRATPTPTRTAVPTATPAPTAVPTAVAPTPTVAPTLEAPLSSLIAPIAAAQQTLMNFGQRSFWLQPWRAYMDTVPGTTLRDALGINFNVTLTEAPRTASTLAAAGVRRARVEFGFNAVRYDDPSALADPSKFDGYLNALKANGIRPLLLLNANQNEPTPVRKLTLHLAQAARTGARTVRLQAADVAAVVLDRTGFDALDASGKAADVLITAIASDGTATLSKPLPRDVAAGSYPGTTLRFAPFSAPLRADGSPNPAFEATLAGWLSYVGAVTTRAKSVLGSDAFDVEVWNELSFGSDFLDAATYYSPLPTALSGHGDIQRTLLERTVAYLRDPAHGVAGVGIGDGFASETPWPSGATEPVGVTAIDKHPYAPVRDYPAQLQLNTAAIGPDGLPNSWTPSIRAFFPEYWLTGLQTENLIRDLAPATTSVYGTPHGRATHPVGGAAPQMWLTETGIDLGDSRLPQADLTAAAKRHILTKGVLRSLLAHVSKGVTALDFYAAHDGVYGLMDDGYFTSSGPAGETVDALARLTAPFAASQALSTRRELTLDGVADRHDHQQFAGDGTPAHPPLYDRDVVAVLPFQLAASRFAIGVYVMTRDVTRLYRPSAPRTDVTRWDLPEATFRLTLGGLRTTARLTATDPLTGDSVPVTVISRSATQTVVELPLTDSPRVILADEG